jgi:GAF domain-containing protein
MDKAVREGHPVRGRPEDPSSGDGTRRPLAVPIAVAGEVIGALDTYKPSDAGPWTDEEIGTLESLAEQLGLSLESARLFEETQRALSETEMLYRAGEAIGAAASPDEILRAITHHVLAPPVDRCVLALADPATPSDQPVVVVEAAWEPGVEEPPWIGDRWSVHRRQGALQLPFLGAVLGAARAGGEGPSRCVFSDVTTATRLDGLSRHTLGVRLGVRAAAAIPLVAGERALGLLLIQSTDEPYEFSEREIRLYLTLADQAAVALDGMRLLEETRRRAQRERLTAEITSHVWSSADVDTILRTAVGELGRSLQASDAWIELESGDGDRTSKGGRRVDDSLRVLSGGDEDGFLSREPARGGGSS